MCLLAFPSAVVKVAKGFADSGVSTGTLVSFFAGELSALACSVLAFVEVFKFSVISDAKVNRCHLNSSQLKALSMGNSLFMKGNISS